MYTSSHADSSITSNSKILASPRAFDLTVMDWLAKLQHICLRSKLTAIMRLKKGHSDAMKLSH